MKTRNSRPDAGTQTPWNMLAEAGRQQVAVATGCATEMFRGFEAMRKVQEDAAHAAAQRHAAMAEKLKSPCGPQDLMALQAELMQFDVSSATRYWQELGAAAVEMQTRMMGCCGQLVDNQALLEAASAFDTATGRPRVT